MIKQLRQVMFVALSMMVFLPFPVSAMNPVARYGMDRLNDFADIFRIRLTAPHNGKSGGFHVRATQLAQVGIVGFQGQMVGMDRRGMGLWRQNRMEGGVGPLYFTSARTEPVIGNSFLDTESPWYHFANRQLVPTGQFYDDGRWRPLSLGAELELPFLPGFDIGLYPEEAIDFVVGFTTLDMFDDDMALIPVAVPVDEGIEPQSPTTSTLSSDFSTDESANPAVDSVNPTADSVEEAAPVSLLPPAQQRYVDESEQEGFAPTVGQPGMVPRFYVPNTSRENVP